jgi:hypothetical protein
MSELATANTEFHDPERIKLLTDLKAVLNCNVSSTVHAHLWLSDIDELKALVDVERRKSGSAEAIFRVTDKDAKTIGKCESISASIPFHGVDLLNVIQGPNEIADSLLHSNHLRDQELPLLKKRQFHRVH